MRSLLDSALRIKPLSAALPHRLTSLDPFSEVCSIYLERVGGGKVFLYRAMLAGMVHCLSAQSAMRSEWGAVEIFVSAALTVCAAVNLAWLTARSRVAESATA